MAETLKSVRQLHDEHGPTDATATFNRLWEILGECKAKVDERFPTEIDPSTEPFWTYGGHSGETERISVLPTSDEGALLVGSGSARGSSEAEVHLRRIAPDGSVRWMRTIPLDGAGDLPSGACATAWDKLIAAQLDALSGAPALPAEPVAIVGLGCVVGSAGDRESITRPMIRFRVAFSSANRSMVLP